MASTTRPVLRFLSATDVRAVMPPVADRLALAERAMTSLVADAELPAKIGVHPRPPGSFGHAMPAWSRGADPSGVGDLLGIKWVTGFPTDRDLGLPALHAMVLLNDPSTGVPTAILDGGPITAERTAAVSGVALARFAPALGDVSVAIVGAGVQARSHIPVIGHVLPGARLRIHDRHPERAEGLAAWARGQAGIGEAIAAGSGREAVDGAVVVVTVATFTGPADRQVMTADWLAADALVVAVDYATMVAAEVADDAALFLVDEREQFVANRSAGQFDGYPDPATTLGEAILAGMGRPARGRVLVTHLGVGLADVIFADAILRRASAAGLGIVLPG